MARAERVASLPLLVYWLTHDCCLLCQAIGNLEGSVSPTVPWTGWGKQGALGSAMQAGSLCGLAECTWDWLCRGEGLRAGRALLGVSGCWLPRDKHQTLRVLLSSSHHAFPFLAPPVVGQDMPQPFPRALLPLFKT